MAQFDVVFAEVENTFDVGFDCVNSFTATMDTVVKVLPDVYEGSYEITPADTEQIIDAKGLTLADNITVNPIPSNYGLITWDGSAITVS